MKKSIRVFFFFIKIVKGFILVIIKDICYKGLLFLVLFYGYIGVIYLELKKFFFL